MSEVKRTIEHGITCCTVDDLLSLSECFERQMLLQPAITLYYRTDEEAGAVYLGVELVTAPDLDK